MTEDAEIPGEFVTRVLARCIEEGDCLVWQGAMNNGTSPVLSFGNRVYAVRRVMWVGMGKKLDPKRHICSGCGNPACVTPEHAIQKTRGIKRGTKKTVAVRHNMAEARRRKARLNWDDVAEIRASDAPVREIARQKSISPDHVRRIQSGQYWNANLNSPFAGLGARP